MKRNIAFLQYDYSFGGGRERVAANLANELCKYYNVFFISFYDEKKSTPYMLDDSINYSVIVDEKGNFLKYGVLCLHRLKKYVAKNKIDLLIAVGISSAIFTSFIGKICNVKSVICEHSNMKNELNNTYGRKFKRFLSVKMTDKIITLTKDDKKEYMKRFHVHPDKIDYIYNWIDEGFLNHKAEYNPDTKKILTVARIDRVKAFENSIFVCKEVVQKEGWTWDVYGDGDEEYLSELQDLVSGLGLENVFCFKGRCEDVRKIYGNYSLYVCTSLFEGLPMSLLEAKAYHIPILSYDIPTGPKEIIVDCVNGFLVKKLDNEMLKKRLVQMMTDRDCRVSFSKNSAINIEKFSKAHILTQWENLIDELCAGS